MSKNKEKTVLERINSEIEKIDKKTNSIYFFVIDTKGNPNGSLEYIYKLANILQDDGYNVTMLYQSVDNEEFVGVREWLGDKFADIPHEDISGENVSVAPSDILFIPEIFANVMLQTKKLPCKRIAILQNYDYMLEQIPMSAQWGTYGIVDAITNTDVNKALLNDIFPYVKSTIIDPYIDDMYGSTDEPKQLIVNIIAKDQDDINKIIKPFYWKFPTYKFVSFRDLRGFPKEIYAKYLREAAITIWVDENTNFGYGALEAMKSGSIVLAKTTTLPQEWMEEEKSTLSNCCVWFDNFYELSNLIASVVRAWTTNKIPSKIKESVDKILPKYTKDKTQKQILDYIKGVLENRKKEMSALMTQIKTDKTEDNDE